MLYDYFVCMRAQYYRYTLSLKLSSSNLCDKHARQTQHDRMM